MTAVPPGTALDKSRRASGEEAPPKGADTSNGSKLRASHVMVAMDPAGEADPARKGGSMRWPGDKV